MSDMLEELRGLFERHGAKHYGEGVCIESHMVQTALWAEAEGAPPHLMAAALLHDVGHLLHPDAEIATAKGQDLEHEALGAAWLSRAFGPEVTAPIALHVQAKRYLCAVEPAYFECLSPSSRLSLSVQGGPMGRGEVNAFFGKPGAADAVRLRRWDDRGKDVTREGGSFAQFEHLLATLQAGCPNAHLAD